MQSTPADRPAAVEVVKENEGTGEAAPVSLPTVYLLLENPRKNNNLGPILRCAAAFGISTVVAVGHDKCAVQGSHGASKHVRLVAFPTCEQAVNFLKRPIDQGGCGCTQILGIMGGVADAYSEAGYVVQPDHESGMSQVSLSMQSHRDERTIKRSFPIHRRPFIEGNCCFSIGKVWQGLPASLADHCDSFVHIPVANVPFENEQGSMAAAGLLDSPSSLCIVLHHFTAWAKYDERGFRGHKFDVADRSAAEMAQKQATRARRAAERRHSEQEAEDAISTNRHGNVFGSEGKGDY